MTKTEYAARSKRGGATVNGKTPKNYNDYLELVLEDWTDNGSPVGKLTDGEVAYLINYVESKKTK